MTGRTAVVTGAGSGIGRCAGTVGGMSTQFVFSMYQLTKVHPPDKTVFKEL